MLLGCLCLLVCYQGVHSEFDDIGDGVNTNGENKPWENFDVRPRLKDPTYLMDRYPLGKIPAESADCRRPAKCIPMQYQTCMGTRLPYTTTTVDLISTHMKQDAIREQLHLFQGLRHIPKCWAVVQPFLCSLYMPKCTNDTVELPSQEMCKMVAGPCRILFNHTIWPNFIKCDDAKLFPRMCKNDVRELKFNTTGKCLKPLIPTDNTLALFEGIEGCGKQCDDPLYTPDQQKQMHSYIAWLTAICAAFNLFAVVTFMIDWRSANKYPAVVIFYINCCFLVSCLGWFIQFAPGNRDVIVCRKDGSPRLTEPSGESILCTVVFVFIYYSLMAAMVWFVILTYAWHMSFQALGRIQDRIDKKSAYFHLMAWCLPLVFTVTVMALGEIAGNSVTGICFLSYTHHYVRVWFLLAPIIVVLLVGGYFLSRGMITLIRLKINSQEIISDRASAKIRETIQRMGLFSVCTLLAAVVTFYCHAYEFQNSEKWEQSFRNYMICSITTKYAEESDCKREFRPSIGNLQLHLLSPFFAGILMSSWVWTSSTVDTWKRFFRRSFHGDVDTEPIKLKKHKVIAQAFAKRKNFNNAGRLSISFRNTHEDPVGLNINLDSVASQDVSSAWAAALPKLVTRRGALVGVTTASVSSTNRRNSGDSEISVSMRRFSVESRRNSVDSQISVQYAEVKATRKVPGSRNRRTKRRRDFSKSSSHKVGPLFRRGSTTSQESQLGAQILSALTIGGIPSIAAVPNMKRRSAIVSLEERGNNANVLDDANVKMRLPFLFSHCNGDRSDENLTDENISGDERVATKESPAKNVDVEAGRTTKLNDDSDSDDSQPDEETKIIENSVEPPRSKSKISNKSTKSHKQENGKRNRAVTKNRYSITDALQDGTTVLNLLEESDISIENETAKKDNRRKSGIGNLASDIADYCPKLRITQRPDAENRAREISTQTSIPIDILEMEELQQSIDEIINSRPCSSKGTQISHKTNKGNGRRT